MNSIDQHAAGGKGRQIKVAILKSLDVLGSAAGASKISEQLAADGFDMQPRTVRFHLLQMDSEGLTKPVSRRAGRLITAAGKAELSHANIFEKVGFIAARIDNLGYRMSFNLRRREGTIILNVATIHKSSLARAFEDMKTVFAKGLGMGHMIVMAREGETVGGFKVPKDMAAIGTVCSVTVNGILFREGIPVSSRFGGLVEIKEGHPTRFLQLIDYAGTTIDPLEAFIQAGMTAVRSAAKSGDGVIGASFREFPTSALADVMRVQHQLDNSGLAGILAIGKPNRPLLDIPVAEGRTGMIIVGGLNPIAALHEGGTKVTIRSLAGLVEFSHLRQFTDLRNEFKG